MIKIGNKQVNKITINGKEVLKVVLNGATKYQKQTTPQWSDWTLVTTNYNYYQQIYYDTLDNLGLDTITEPPAAISLQAYCTYMDSNGTSLSYKTLLMNQHPNNYLVDGVYGSTQQMGTNSTGAVTYVFYPKWSVRDYSGKKLWTCNMTIGSGTNVQGWIITIDQRTANNFFRIQVQRPSTSSFSCNIYSRIILCDDVHTSVNYPLSTSNLNWTWDYMSYSGWGSGLTRLQSYTVPLTVAKVKFSQFNITSNFTTDWYIDFSSYQSTTNRQIGLYIPLSDISNYTFILSQYQLTRYTTESQNLVFRLYTTSGSTTYQFYFNISTYQGSSNKRLDLIRGSHSTASPFTLNPVFTIETLPQ